MSYDNNSIVSAPSQGGGIENYFIGTKWPEKRLLCQETEGAMVATDFKLPDLNSSPDFRQGFLDGLHGVNQGFLYEYFANKFSPPEIKSTASWKVRLELKQEVEVALAGGGELSSTEEGKKIIGKQTRAMSFCSRVLEFREDKTALGGSEFKFERSQFCRVRTCPVCQWRKSLRWVARFHERLPRIMEDYPTNRFLLLTLTVKNVPVSSLREAFKSMQAGWMKLRRVKSFPAVGYLKSFEVTRSGNGEAHPHFHILLHVPSSYFSGSGYIKQEDWQELWRRSMGLDYNPVIDIRVVGGSSRKKLTKQEKYQRIFKGVLEIVKYETKVAELIHHPEFLRELVLQIRSRRTIDLGGTLKDYLGDWDLEGVDRIEEVGDSWKLNEEEVNSALLPESSELVHRFCWDREKKRYFLLGDKEKGIIGR
jgi:plasmid rolling circle replication initiator protein Rep